MSLSYLLSTGLLVVKSRIPNRIKSCFVKRYLAFVQCGSGSLLPCFCFCTFLICGLSWLTTDVIKDIVAGSRPSPTKCLFKNARVLTTDNPASIESAIISASTKSSANVGSLCPFLPDAFGSNLLPSLSHKSISNKTLSMLAPLLCLYPKSFLILGMTPPNPFQF